MAKQKKFFKQKIRQMISQIENSERLKPPRSPLSTTQITAERPDNSYSNPSLIVVKSDLKRIALCMGIMILIIISVLVISYKTNWLLDFASAIYNWAGLAT